MSEDKVDKIAKIDEEVESTGSAKSAEPVQRVAPNEERFNTMMQQEEQTGVARAQPPSDKLTLMDAVRDLNYSGVTPNEKVTTKSLLDQTQQAITKIDEVKETLSAPNISIKSPTHVKLLQNKLTHIDESLKIALSKAGLEFSTENVAALQQPAKGAPNPIERFLGYLTDGQWQLQNLTSELQAMEATQKELTPVNMLAIQIKVGQIQQELELFSGLLNKALESIKTIMNIQV